MSIREKRNEKKQNAGSGGPAEDDTVLSDSSRNREE